MVGKKMKPKILPMRITLGITYTFIISFLLSVLLFVILDDNAVAIPSLNKDTIINTSPSYAEVNDNQIFLTLNPVGKGGEYFTKGKIIVIYADALDTYSDALDLFNHEYGHYLFHDKLYWYERTKYEQEVFSNANTFVSEYARDCTKWYEYCTRHEEDFAETFSHSIQNGNFNISYVPEDRREFFRKYILGELE